ncbi:ribonuclease D [Thiomicrorhabdus sediminis]|uniref:Ribonuclease D n=1 Tax=Thiomicrorhabdus sediminis TaxID=2580412 RepID=A0A4P9K5R2_9GAMM|nr:HRDC domain-containing protein [Thiomicrorhabdus sediminis]QCU89810.1 ribonuclease D [Thiomicrorhabdus sediminis]
MSKPSYLSIDTEAQLNDYCQQILANSALSWLAIDTEFVRVDTYYPQLSLVQIQDCLGQAAIIDPLAIVDTAQTDKPLHALVELLANPNVIKVFHAARQDIEVLYQLEGIMPQAIFDTQIAAIFRQHGDIAGFSRVIESELGIRLDKSQTRTNWHQRPLTEKQIAYALDDVRYLAPLYEKYRQQLDTEQLAAVAEDCLALLDSSLYDINPEEAIQRIRAARNLKGKHLAIAQVLAQWRESYAQEHDIPKKWPLSDDCLIQIAKRPPKTEKALYKVPNIKASSVKEFGQQWVALIDEVFALDSEQLPKAPPKQAKASVQEEILLDVLYAYSQQLSIDYKLNTTQLINKDELLALIRQPDQTKLIGWRQYLLGSTLQKLLRGELAIKLQNDKICLDA